MHVAVRSLPDRATRPCEGRVREGHTETQRDPQEAARMLDQFRRRNESSSHSAGSRSQTTSPLGTATAVRSPEPATPAIATQGPAAAATAPPAPAPSPAVADAGRSSVSKLIVGTDIHLKGAEISDCDTLVVEGRVEASIESRVIEVAETGVYTGNATVEIAEISGRFQGELTVRKQLLVRASGQVSGRIRYGRLAVEDGGELGGDIDVLSADAARVVRPLPEVPGAPAAKAESPTKPERAAVVTASALAPR